MPHLSGATAPGSRQWGPQWMTFGDTRPKFCSRSTVSRNYSCCQTFGVRSGLESCSGSATLPLPPPVRRSPRQLGYADGEKLSRATVLDVLRRIAASVEVPVTADIEAGYAQTLADLDETTAAVIDAGVVGINLEGWAWRRRSAS